MRLERYEARTSLLMTVLALVFLGVYAVNVIATGFPAWLSTAARSLNGVIWIAFAVDLVIRVALAEQKAKWLLSHPIEVASVILPVLRPLNVLRVFTAGQALLGRKGGLIRTGEAVLVTAALLVLMGALAVLDAERGVEGAIIQNFGDALWWAITTVTTVGYGDMYPVTTAGRIIAAVLMVVGISVLGVITASVAAWFVDVTEKARAAGLEEFEQQGAADDDAAAGVPEPESPSALLDTDAKALLGALRRAGVLTDDEVARAVGRLPAG